MEGWSQRASIPGSSRATLQMPACSQTRTSTGWRRPTLGFRKSRTHTKCCRTRTSGRGTIHIGSRFFGRASGIRPAVRPSKAANSESVLAGAAWQSMCAHRLPAPSSLCVLPCPPGPTTWRSSSHTFKTPATTGTATDPRWRVRRRRAGDAGQTTLAPLQLRPLLRRQAGSAPSRAPSPPLLSIEAAGVP